MLGFFWMSSAIARTAPKNSPIRRIIAETFPYRSSMALIDADSKELKIIMPKRIEDFVCNIEH